MTAQQPTTDIYRATDRNRKNRRVLIIFCLMAIVLGAYQAWDTRNTMNSDGISYLDMGDAYVRGDWDMAVNAYWSPLYSWLLGLAILIFNPSPYWEFSVVHLANFLIYLCALVCFYFFLKQLIHYHRHRISRSPECKYANYPEWALIVFGYSLFIWTSLDLITISIVTPDMCVAAFVYLASGILLRIRRGSISRLTFLTLGVVLGFSYLAKAIMFPLSFIFLLISLFLVGNFRKAMPRVLIALTGFLLVAGPFISALSDSKGRLTYGDSGKLNYAWYVNSVTQWVHWQGEPPGSGIPWHPTRKIFNEPAVYEFGTPIGGTYPPWYDPSYWHEGVRIHFNLSEQLPVIKKILSKYADILFKLQPSLITGCLILYYLSRRRWLCVKDIAGQWSLFIPAIAAMGIYSLVHVENRFIGVFIVLFWAGIFSGVRLPESDKSKTLLSCIPVFIAMLIMIGVVYSPLLKAYNQIKSNRISSAPHVSWQVAETLNRMGLRAGDKVASIGWSGSNYWARLARFRIVADIPKEEKYKFLEADRSIKSQVYETFSKTGAKAIVIYEDEGLQCYDYLDEWKRIGDTPYFVYILSE
ncbi:hypothetical protein BMS3Abin15_01191 [bacterium BMS3Abin15]|nr:hypothetical protein BMS3Abin15_01191 [bacterium BMS3Abin15]